MKYPIAFLVFVLVVVELGLFVAYHLGQRSTKLELLMPNEPGKWVCPNPGKTVPCSAAFVPANRFGNWWENPKGYVIIPNPTGDLINRLVPGLKVKRVDEPWRCAKCQQMQPAGTYLVWVSDSLLYGDTPEVRAEIQSKIGWGNDAGSGWCLDCAPKVH